MASPYGNGANPVGNLLLTAATDDDAELNEETIAGLIPNNTGGTGGSTLPDPVQAGTDFNTAANTADDALDQANADAEDDRVAAVTGVRDDLDSGLETADVTWGGTMDTAGAALGSALDGIQDFDWQHVRNYVGAVTGARRAAEIGALTAQVGFVTSYTGAVNNYTASIATAGVTHVTGYAQATADYYVDTAEQEALAAESAVTTAITNGASSSEVAALTTTATAKRAKADAFATYATSYVTYLTTEAQTAATSAVTNVTSANTTALATITTEVATATTDINTFYDGQVATAANPPPVDTDLDNDGQPDPPTPTSTQSITTSITAAKTANTTSRAVVHTAFAGQIARRETSTTNSEFAQQTGTAALQTSSSTGTNQFANVAYTSNSTPTPSTPQQNGPRIGPSPSAQIVGEQGNEFHFPEIGIAGYIYTDQNGYQRVGRMVNGVEMFVSLGAAQAYKTNPDQYSRASNLDEFFTEYGEGYKIEPPAAPVVPPRPRNPDFSADFDKIEADGIARGASVDGGLKQIHAGVDLGAKGVRVGVSLLPGGVFVDGVEAFANDDKTGMAMAGIGAVASGVKVLDDLGAGASQVDDLLVEAAKKEVRESLPAVNKAINSDILYAGRRAVEKGLATVDEEATAIAELKELTKSITKSGFPTGTSLDPGKVIARSDSVLVPFRNGAAVYEVSKNGTARLRTVLSQSELKTALEKLTQ